MEQRIPTVASPRQIPRRVFHSWTVITLEGDIVLVPQPYSNDTALGHPLASLYGRMMADVLVARIGDRAYAVPLAAVERTLPMAALLPLPEVPQGVVGVLDLHGTILPVVDPRPRLGSPTPPYHPGQRLVVIRAGTRFLLWVDGAERITCAATHAFDGMAGPGDGSLMPFLVHVDGESIPVLAPQALDPGPILARSLVAGPIATSAAEPTR